MRILVTSMLLLCGTPAFAQSPTELDARCVGPTPGRPSYEPPPWLGDDPPRSRSARAAEHGADTLARRFGSQPIPLRWVRQIADLRWEQCLLGSDPAPCSQGIALYERSLHEEGYQAPARRDQGLFRLATLLVRNQMVVRAREILDRLMKQHPSSALRPGALILLGGSHVTVGDYGRAERYFALAAQLVSPHQGTATYLAAWAALGAGHLQQARDFAVRALSSSRGEVQEAIVADWCAMSGA